jgi:sortase family protein
MSERRRLAAILGAVLTVVAVAVYLALSVRPPVVSGQPAAAAVPTSTPTPTPTPTPSGPPRDFVAQSAPTSFEITGRAFTIKAHVCRMPYVLPLDPPGDQFHTVCWVDEKFGVAPGSDANGTSYILGHAWAEANLVLNPLSLYALKHTDPNPTSENGVPLHDVTGMDGYRIVLGTPKGQLTYTVDRAFTVAKTGAINVPSIMAANTPDRIVIITCGVKDGQDVDVNVVVYASLTSSVAA